MAWRRLQTESFGSCASVQRRHLAERGPRTSAARLTWEDRGVQRNSSQRTVAGILFVAGIGAILAGIALGLLVSPWLFLIAIAGCGDLLMSRYFVGQGERATPSGSDLPD